MEFSTYELLELSAQLRHNFYIYSERTGQKNVALSGSIRDLRIIEALVTKVERELTKRGLNVARETIDAADKFRAMDNPQDTSDAVERARQDDVKEQAEYEAKDEKQC